ncbi:DNA cytosine methyltransferase [Neptunicella sp.]|uniref:DNA cytosine methyltransferase n=1 Tax=Neptunicella sp. TaxID=2125986 RepID=UPI003F69257B
MLFNELLIDNFAGGGGASQGIYQATGRHVDIAINHDQSAIDMHTMNHPSTEHFCESVWDVNPVQVTKGLPVGVAWFSPDCKHFSKAKGSKPVNKTIRGLAWVAVRWAATAKPRVIYLENVEEFKTWGPLVNGEPCKKRKGQTFNAFIRALQRLGYQVETKELRACDYGAPTIRKRLFLIARRDGQPIKWPKATHGDPTSDEVKKGKLKPWRTAAECIDWSLPCPSIFERKKPLAENTLRRIAKGIQKFVIDTQEPFIVTCNHGGIGFRGQSINDPMLTLTASRDAHGLVQPVLTPFITEHANASNQRNMPIDEPLRTICAQVKGGHFAVVAPTLIQTGYGERKGQSPRVLDLHKPLGTVVAGGQKHALVAAFLDKYYGPKSDNEVRAVNMAEPIHTVTTENRFSVVTSHLMKLRGTCQHGQPIEQPMPTITAGGNHAAEVRAFLVKYYGTNIGHQANEPIQTITTKHRFGLVTIHGVDYQIVDIGMRMLQPRELFLAQGFRPDYIIDVKPDGSRVTKADQVARCGNAVPPPFAEALIRANQPELCQQANQSEVA